MAGAHGATVPVSESRTRIRVTHPGLGYGARAHGEAATAEKLYGLIADGRAWPTSPAPLSNPTDSYDSAGRSCRPVRPERTRSARVWPARAGQLVRAGWTTTNSVLEAVRNQYLSHSESFRVIPSHSESFQRHRAVDFRAAEKGTRGPARAGIRVTPDTRLTPNTRGSAPVARARARYPSLGYGAPSRRCVRER